ncbi:hypothetical protein KP509_24G059700 [Ceratopteris richardii]|uniref:PB1 domain-containing protein n=1 Tax=Ceratopteris richardii TaxID=49495 RepID=A0A8T2RXU1_CERRI|nr:hypothetical protein KP509_24G059700 [Ceratopteris richardii]
MHDAANRQTNGEGFRQKGVDHHHQNGGEYRYTGSSKSYDGSDQRSRRDGNSGGRRQRSRSRDRPYYQQYQKNQRWEGKENSDQNKVIAATTTRDEGVSKTQEYTLDMASRARELKEEGNRLFQKKDYFGAMDHYEQALILTPLSHPDRAVFHSNRAACLMQMKPPQHDAAIHECDLALEAHPGLPRALLRRARAYESLGKLELALQDVQKILQADGAHPDAMDMAKRIRFSMGCQGDEAQRDRADSSHQEQVQTPAILSPLLASRQSFKEMHSTPHAVSRSLSLSCALNTPPPAPSQEMVTRVHKSDAPPNTPTVEALKSDSSEKIIHQDNPKCSHVDTSTSAPILRPVKLIYDHDIRLAELPVNCKFGELRKIVKSKFPAAKSILIKYKDVEGDLVTITSTEELRLAEAAAAVESARRNLQLNNTSSEVSSVHGRRPNSAIGLPVVPSLLDQLRLHIVEVPAEQEPYDKEEVVSIDPKDSLPVTESIEKDKMTAIDKSGKEKDFDKWLLEFAHLFRRHLGIDPTGNVDFHELGLEFCAEALEETITTEDAHKLFEQAGCKFQEMVATGFLNWGNVYMCAARKEVLHDNENDDQTDFCEKLQTAFNWAQAQYALAEEKFLLSLKVKPDFCDGMLGLGQKYFESAKLNWALAVAKEKDLSVWDPSKTLQFFCTAAEYSQKAAELLKDQDDALKTQIYLSWGNVLYEHSQVECRIGLNTWKQHLEGALEKFELANVSSADINLALEKHLSNSSCFTENNSHAEQYMPETDVTCDVQS